MRYTGAQFLEVVCRWAYDHHTLFIEDQAVLSQFQSQGMSDSDIQRLKEELERGGAIKNRRVIGGMRDFELSRGVFRRYLQRTLPPANVAKARELYESWQCSSGGTFSVASFVKHLGVSEKEASYYLEALQ